MKITPRQEQYLHFIRYFKRAFHAAPSIADIRDGMNLKSDNGALKAVRQLELKGYIRRTKTPYGRALARSITLIK